MRAGLRVNEGRSEAAAAVINIKDWREMQRPAPAPLITYTKYLRRASSRSPRANSSRPLAIAVPLRPASVIKRSHRLDSLAGPAPCGERGAGCAARAGGRRAGRAVCRRPLTVLCRARCDQPHPETTNSHQQHNFSSSLTVTVGVLV